MYDVTVTNDPVQKQVLILPDSSSISIQIRYVPMQYGWVIDFITYESWTINSLWVVNSPNLLRQFKNEIPFGLACQTVGNREPMFQNDFSTGTSNLFILTQDEVLTFENYLSGI